MYLKINGPKKRLRREVIIELEKLFRMECLIIEYYSSFIGGRGRGGGGKESAAGGG